MGKYTTGRWVRVLCILALVGGMASHGLAESMVQGDGFVAFLPFVRGWAMAGNWSVVVPEATTNMIASDPSYEEGGSGWTQSITATGATSQSSAWSKDRLYSLLTSMTDSTAASEYVLRYQDVTVSAETDYAFSAWVNAAALSNARARLQVDWRNGGGLISSITVDRTSTGVERLELTGTSPATTTTARVRLSVWSDAASATGTVYWDGVQVEQKSGYCTTYCDGEQPGCEWDGEEDLSTSSRSAQSRAGGRVRNFDDYSFYPGQMSGMGMPPTRMLVDRYALAPGGEAQGYKVEVRPFVITGLLNGTSMSNLHALRQALLEVVRPGGVAGNQPVRLRYDGATEEKEIAAFYDGGLEMGLQAEAGPHEVIGLRFLAVDPYWYEIGESAALLDHTDTDASRGVVAARLRSTGQWDTLGPPDGAGTYTSVNTIAVGPDGVVYVGGDFVNFDNIAAADYIAKYTPSTSTWSALSALSGIVNDIVIAPDGTLYAGGVFTNAGGVAAADYIAHWTGSAWEAVGTPNTGAASITAIRAMAFDSSGNLYVVGSFENLGDVAAADYIAVWDGSSWAAVGTPNTGAASITYAYAVVVDSQDNVYVGGDFTNWADDADADYIAMWNGSAWSALDALSSDVRDLAVDAQDRVYAGGNFTNAGGDANADYIAMWNGQAWEAMGTGLNTTTSDLVVGPDGVLYAAGGFGTAGGLAVPGVTKWNGASWSHPDFSYATGAPGAIAVGPADSVVAQNYDVWVGFTDEGTLAFAGDATVTNDGTEAAYPRIVVYRDGGTSATLYSVRNETTGKELLFAYDLLDGETLTIDLHPDRRSVVSSFFGSRLDAVLANSDFGDFVLQPGANTITCFVDVAGAPTLVAWMEWRDAYWSMD